MSNPRGQFGQFSGSGSGNFPDPFADIASLHTPANLRSAMHWC